MKVPQYRYRCPLGNLQPTTPDLDAVKREGWRNDHILVVSEQDERLDWIEQQLVRRLENVCTAMEASAMADTRTDWTADEVAARFADAADTAHKLPRVRPGGYFNPWMTLAMQVPERYPDPDRLYRTMPPSPQAVERMLETMRWVQWLEVEQRHLVWMRANRYEWQQIGRRFACDRNTASRRWHRLMELVAYRLNFG